MQASKKRKDQIEIHGCSPADEGIELNGGGGRAGRPKEAKAEMEEKEKGGRSREAERERMGVGFFLFCSDFDWELVDRCDMIER